MPVAHGYDGYDYDGYDYDDDGYDGHSNHSDQEFELIELIYYKNIQYP